MDVRDEIIRFLLNNRQQSDARINPREVNNGRATPSNRQRFTQPIFKWPFSYAGKQDILELAVFLNRVKTYADTEDVDEYSLLRGIKHLLRGRALEWHTRNYNHFNTWNEFKDQIKAEFLPSSSSQLIKRDLYWRFQGQEETFSKYYQDLLALFEVVEPPLSSQDKFFILKSNLNPEFAAVASASRALSVSDLVAVCKDYDNVKMFSQNNKTSQNPRMGLSESTRVAPSYPRIARNSAPAIAWNRPTPVRNHQVNIVEEEELDLDAVNPDHQQSEEAYTQEGAANFQSGEVQVDEVNALRSRGSWTSHGTKPPESTNISAAISCWQCEQPGHLFTACRNPKTFLFCYRCGKKGFTSRNCTDCLVRMTQALPDSAIRSYQGNAGAGFQK